MRRKSETVLVFFFFSWREEDKRKIRAAVLWPHPLLDEGVFVLHLPLLHGRVDDQLIQLHTDRGRSGQRDIVLHQREYLSYPRSVLLHFICACKGEAIKHTVPVKPTSGSVIFIFYSTVF